MTKLLSLLLLVGIAGCADYSINKGSLELADSGAADTGETEDSYETASPAWYAVRASLTILGGAAVADGATITVEVVDEDLERVDCSFDIPVEGLEAMDVAGDGVWWTTAVTAPEDTCAEVPAELTLGVAELHPSVRARLGTVGLDDVADSLYGAWIRTPGDDEAAVFGYAGTESDLAGDDPAALPPPDGVYQLSPLYLLALPE